LDINFLALIFQFSQCIHHYFVLTILMASKGFIVVTCQFDSKDCILNFIRDTLFYFSAQS